MLVVFYCLGLGEKYPIVDLSLFKDRNFTVGVIATSLGFMVYMGTLTLLPLVLQTNLGYTSTWAGLAAAPVGILPVFLSPLIGRFGNKIDMRLFVTASFLTLQMMLDRGKELDWFASGEIITLGVVALVCLSYFIVWDWEKNIRLSIYRCLKIGILPSASLPRHWVLWCIWGR